MKSKGNKKKNARELRPVTFHVEMPCRLFTNDRDTMRRNYSLPFLMRRNFTSVPRLSTDFQLFFQQKDTWSLEDDRTTPQPAPLLLSLPSSPPPLSIRDGWPPIRLLGTRPSVRRLQRLHSFFA
jgi:hypothetical protein